MTTLRFFPDYSSNTPLWDAEDDDTTPASLGLSATLQADLADWVAEWEFHFHWEKGWPTSHLRDAWMLRGQELLERVRNELSGVTVVPMYEGYWRVTERPFTERPATR